MSHTTQRRDALTTSSGLVVDVVVNGPAEFGEHGLHNHCQWFGGLIR